MISVDNFYWILYENLLAPLQMDAYYYHPFGTMNSLSQFQFKPLTYVRQANHVLFHFDQEPLWDGRLGQKYETFTIACERHKFLKLLANSEKSASKALVCKDQHMLDWYYFYHGFAALDWFRDSAHVGDIQMPTKVFSSLSHNIRCHRSYRLSLTAKLIAADICHLGHVSLHAGPQDIIDELTDVDTQLSENTKHLISKNLLPMGPMVVDKSDINATFSAHFGFHELKFWQQSLWHVVNETVFYADKLHLTEKVFKPIVAMRPFLLAAAPGNLAYLRSYGFLTFDTWIDESYDQEPDHDKRLDMISNEIVKLCNLPRSQLAEMHHDMMPVLAHNKSHMFGRFKQIILDELVDNFDQCIRIWNNGRVDGRELPLHSNLNSVKKMLLA